VSLDTEPQLDGSSVVTEQPVELVGAPEVERAFLLVRVRRAGIFRRNTVGVFGRIEPAVRVRHLPHDIEQGVFRHFGVERVAGHLRALDQREHELRLVVEHLLEMRHAPAGVDRIAVKAAANVIAHAAERHGAQRPQHDVPRRRVGSPRVLAQEEQQLRGPRKFGRVAEAAVARIERVEKLFHRPVQRIDAGHGPHRRGLLHRREPLCQRLRRLDDLAALHLPDPRDLFQDVGEAGTTPLR
jgi:hypothetical protein